ncbi:hypothetical protein [Pseudomonas sp. H1h]|uniref:hypothetical protein n=1 Tax=Pseudomonas sp. H1h TaxID=1397280 RepID=UPI0004696E16|nr:hypothetical protein [Pseudomonas sp. H1h]
MTIYQDKETGVSGSSVGVLLAPLPVLPDGRGPAGNLIPIDAIPVGRNLLLEISTTTWTTPHDADSVSVQVTRTAPPPNPANSDFTTVPRVSLGPVAGRPATFIVEVPASFLGEDATPAGPTPIWVRIALYQRNLNQLSSDVVQFFIDRTAPWQAKPTQTGPNPGATPGAKSVPLVTFPNAPGVGTTIDDEFAANNPNGLKVAIDTTYSNFQTTDRLTLYAAGTRTDPPAVAPIWDAPIPVSGEVEVPLHVLRAVITGRVQIWFRLTDVSGNFSSWSVNYRNVLFLPLPILASPIIPLAERDNLIDLPDVRLGVTVMVLRPTNTLNTDIVSLQWGSQTAQDRSFGSDSSVTFVISWATLSAEYFLNQTGTNFEVPVIVTADLLRGGISISTSSKLINTDYSVVGNPYPIDPVNPPDEVNPELKPLIVRGQPPVVDNLLGPQDVNQTATIYIDLSPVSGGVWPDPLPGDLVTVRFKGDAGEVVVVSEPLTTANVNTIIQLGLPYAILGPGGLGEKDVSWELENPNRNNLQEAAKTKLTVDTVVIILDAPEFVRPAEDTGTPDEFIICNSLTAPTRFARFRIPPNDHFVQDMEITFNWRGFRTDDYLTPAPADTEFTSTRRISAAELINGMIFDVGPYDPVIRNVPAPPPATPDDSEFYAGYVKVWYSTPIVSSSVVKQMTIYLLNADFKYCESEPGWLPTP